MHRSSRYGVNHRKLGGLDRRYSRRARGAKCREAALSHSDHALPLMKIHTCALMPFTADEMFFTRDSGLLCKSLQALGVESNVIMPMREGEGADPPDVIRMTSSQSIDSTWWKGLGIDGVVFITWGHKQHTPIIRAARAAGIRTCALFDNNGEPFPYGDILIKSQILWRKGKFIETLPNRLLGTAVRVLLCAVKGIPRQYHRSVQMGVPHIAAFQTPKSMERSQKVARLFPWVDCRSEALVLGYAIPDSPPRRMETVRRTNVVAIARWDALRHKRPHMLIHVIERVLKLHPRVTFDIFGRLIPAIEKWHGGLEESGRERVRIHGIKPSALVMEAVASSQVLYCPSVEEGVPLPVIEALSAGCSVAGLGIPSVPGLYWAISEGHGTGAQNDSVNAHSDAVLAELRAWEDGRRNPIQISLYWQQWFSCKTVSGRLLSLIMKVDAPSQA
jgi:glycosyltransferase involved in cell wall biosynthesis